MSTSPSRKKQRKRPSPSLAKREKQHERATRYAQAFNEGRLLRSINGETDEVSLKIDVIGQQIEQAEKYSSREAGLYLMKEFHEVVKGGFIPEQRLLDYFARCFSIILQKKDPRMALNIFASEKNGTTKGKRGKPRCEDTDEKKLSQAEKVVRVMVNNPEMSRYDAMNKVGGRKKLEKIFEKDAWAFVCAQITEDREGVTTKRLTKKKKKAK